MSSTAYDNTSEKDLPIDPPSGDASRKSSLPGLPTLPQNPYHAEYPSTASSPTHIHHGTSHEPLRPTTSRQSRQSRISEVYGREVPLEAAGLNAVDLSATAASRAGDERTWQGEMSRRAGGVEYKMNEGDADAGEEEKGGTEDEGERGEGEEEVLPRMSKARIVWLAVTMLLTFFMSVSLPYTVGGSGNPSRRKSGAVTLLIPPIARALDTTELQAQWVASAYTLAFGCGLIFSGRLADIFGRRILYLSGLTFYALCALLTGLIRNLIAICLFRAFAGLGLSVAVSAGFGIMGTNVRHEPARTIVFAAFGLGMPVGAVVGTMIGAGIAGTGGTNWPYVFFLLMGLALLIAVMGFFFTPPDRKRAPGSAPVDKRVDWVGGFTLMGAVCLFTFSLSASGSAPDGWRTPYVPALFATSFLLLALFVLWTRHLERRTSYPPIIKLALFSRYNYRISIICAYAFFASCGVSGWIMTTSLYYQTYEGLDPWGNAVRILPSSLVGIFAAGSMMYLVPRFKAPHLIAPGMLLTSIGSLLYAVKPEGTNYWAVEFPANICMPWGIDLAIGIGNILMSNLLAQSEQSTGGGVFQTAGQVGSALGICLTTLIASHSPGIQGLRHAFWFTTACGWMVVFFVAVGLRKVGLAKDVAKA